MTHWDSLQICSRSSKTVYHWVSRQSRWVYQFRCCCRTPSWKDEYECWKSSRDRVGKGTWSSCSWIRNLSQGSGGLWRGSLVKRISGPGSGFVKMCAWLFSLSIIRTECISWKSTWTLHRAELFPGHQTSVVLTGLRVIESWKASDHPL